MENNGEQLRDFVYSGPLIDFVRAANDCCLYLEALKGDEGRDFISTMVNHLSAVYNLYLGLGETSPVFDSGVEPTVSEQDWSTLFQRIALILKEHNDVVRIAEDQEFDRSEIVRHTISEDLSDVYQELRDFTSIYSRGIEELMNDAAWELQQRFTEHWGGKLLRALLALHTLYTEGVDPGGEEHV